MRPFFASHSAGGFPKVVSCNGWQLKHLQITSQQPQNKASARRSRACLPVPKWTSACLCLPGVFQSALTHILRAFHSADIGIKTASSCEKPTCIVPELVAGSSYQFAPGSASDPFTADSLHYVRAQPALVVTQHFLHAYETPSCLPTHFAVTLSMYTLIPTVYRALLKSAVSGIGHRIHTTKEKTSRYPLPSAVSARAKQCKPVYENIQGNKHKDCRHERSLVQSPCI